MAKWTETGWYETLPQWIEDENLSSQWVECGWAELGWIEGDEVCPPLPDVTSKVTPGQNVRLHTREKRQLGEDYAVIEMVIKAFVEIQGRPYG